MAKSAIEESAALNKPTSSAATVLQNTEPLSPGVDGAVRIFDNIGYRYHHTPTMIRTSNVSVEYARQNPHDALLQVELLPKSDIMDMTLHWNKQEKADQRSSISKKDFSPKLPIISCIYWKEQGFNIVTSVDIVVILEYLIQQSFSIEEKNRIRRNLQSLKPLTISRNNKKFDRFFTMLMKMEDPRPRNIEKDLKVFKWNDLLAALEKVTSKYSPNLEHRANWKYINHPPGNKTVNIDVGDGSNKARDRNIGENHFKEVSGANDTTTDSSPFLPNERLKVLKRKNTQGDNISQIGIKRKIDLFQHALKPTDPIPLKSTFENKFNSKHMDHLKVFGPERKEPSTTEYDIVSSPGSSGDDELGSASGNSAPLTKPTSISSRSGHIYEAQHSKSGNYENVTQSLPTSIDLKTNRLSINSPYRPLNTHDYQYPIKPPLYLGDEKTGQLSNGPELLHANIIRLNEFPSFEVNKTSPSTFNANLSPIVATEKPLPTADLIPEKIISGNDEKTKLPTLSTLLPSLKLASSIPPTNSTVESYVPSALPVYDPPGLFHLPPARVPNKSSYDLMKNHSSEHLGD